MKTKTCSKCHEPKPATPEYFYRRATGKDGLRASCKVCQSSYWKKLCRGEIVPRKRRFIKPGDKFQMLTAIRRSNRKIGGKYYWWWLCDCGNTKEILLGNVTCSGTKSCGCLAASKSPSDIAMKIVLTNYKRNAKRRGYCWELTEDQAAELFAGDCHYCGAKPVETQEASRYNWTRNGIDRVNNTQGYTEENCVSCCKTCNSMKKTLSKVEFLEHVQRILDFSLVLC